MVPMSKLTPEQRKERMKQRMAEKKALYDRFPPARLDSCHELHGTIVELAGGEDLWLSVRYRDKESGLEEWVRDSIRLDDLLALARFINALICRYNEMAKEINKLTGTSMLPPSQFNSSPASADLQPPPVK